MISTILALGSVTLDKKMIFVEEPIILKDTSSAVKEINVNGEKLTIDESKGIVTYQDITTPIIIDDLQMPREPVYFSDTPKMIQDIVEDEYASNIEKSAILGTDGFVHLIYYNPNNASEIALDIYIEETFYSTNQAALDDFWDKFFPRFQKLKELTGWSSLKWFGVPVEIYNYGHSAACYGGNASPTHANVVFSDPMYQTGCNKPYYDGGSTHYNNPGELGDWWPYMSTALHEVLHSISPYPIYTRSWLTEGWSEYYMYNTLTYTMPGNLIPDINQETADTYLYKGFAGYQWDPYVANDFHDTTVYNRELQRSHGYDITGHMFSKMVYEEGMDWDLFYLLMNNNRESLDRTFSLGPPYIYYTDAFVLNVFGKAMGHTNWETQSDPLFNYYTTPGHGYGARNISMSDDEISMPYGDFNWFGDLIPINIIFSEEEPDPDESIIITTTIYNGGDVNMGNISVKLYVDLDLIEEQFVSINKFQSRNLDWDYSGESGEHLIEIIVDEENIKIELDDSNNYLSEILNIGCGPVPPILEPFANITLGEMSYLRIYPKATDLNEDNLTFFIDSNLFTWVEDHEFLEDHFYWKTGPTSSGSYSFTVNVTDGQFWDEQTINIQISNACIEYDRNKNCWIGCTCPEEKEKISEFFI